MRAKPFLLGLTTGLVGGLTAILLSTPQSGKQLRKNIMAASQKTKTNLQEIKHHTNSIVDSFSTLKREVQNNIPDIMNELGDSFTKFQRDTQPEKEKLKQEIEYLQKTINEFENNLAEPNNKNGK